MGRLPIICLTPVKNEEWILERFLQAASLWADHIVVADQHSTDTSRAIASRFPKVRLVHNQDVTYSEVSRQQLLVNTARLIAQPSVLIALDADEFLTANVLTSPEWQQAVGAAPGTVFEFTWANVLSDLTHYWAVPSRFLGFVDDGSEQKGGDIHNNRLPFPRGAPRMVFKDIFVLHYQYADWARMQSKHRWYQCWERVRYPHKRALDIYRLYHHMDHIPRSTIRQLPCEWRAAYYDRDIDLGRFAAQPMYWWDREVLGMFERYGTETFRKEAIWDCDWNNLARQVYGENAPRIDDPRRPTDKAMHTFLRTTQPLANTLPMQAFQKLFALIGW
ncbi:MAG TPA: glycosyltransferase family 2 protein [Chloroflexaceae bacterium]|nr:glycosyltransferase family 2 protein [Chloroflexaceae bacterium]